MEGWIAIWKTYHRVCTRKKLLRDVFLHLSVADRLFAIGLAILFVGSAGLFICANASHWDHSLWALVAMVTCELVILFKSNQFRESWASKEFGGVPKAPEEVNHRDSRYLLLRKGLRDAGVFEDQIKACMPLVEMQIDMAGTEGLPQKKTMNFALGAASGLAVASLRTNNLNDMTFIVGAILLGGWTLSVYISWFPTKLERMKELKYFLLLYCMDLEASPRE